MRVDRGAQPSLASATERPGQIRAGGSEDQDRLADQGVVETTRPVLVGFARQLGMAPDQPAGEKGRDVELLPGGEVVADHEGDLSIVAHGRGYAAGARGPS